MILTDESLDLDLIEAENDDEISEEILHEHSEHPLSRQPTTSIDETDTTTTTELRVGGCAGKKTTTASLALQIVHFDSVDTASEAKEPLTLAEEMASFEYIDELAASVTSSSSFSDFGKKHFPLISFKKSSQI